MCSGSEAGSYSRLIDFVYHSTLGLRVIKKKRRTGSGALGEVLVTILILLINYSNYLNLLNQL